jgi:hypothetical protein
VVVAVVGITEVSTTVKTAVPVAGRPMQQELMETEQPVKVTEVAPVGVVVITQAVVADREV